MQQVSCRFDATGERLNGSGDERWYLLVEHGECSDDGGLGVSSSETLSEESEEDGEVDGSGGLLEHSLDLRVGGERSHGRVEVLQVLLKRGSIVRVRLIVTI